MAVPCRPTSDLPEKSRTDHRSIPTLGREKLSCQAVLRYYELTRMRYVLLLLVWLLPVGSSLLADEGNLLNVAILKLPPKQFGDIPLSRRHDFLLSMSEDLSDRLDYEHGWLHFYTDSPLDSPSDCQFWIKLLPRQDDTPLVFIHLAKSIFKRQLSKDQTFVFEWNVNEWLNVTKKYLPNDIIFESAFIPERKSSDIQVGPYQKGKAWKDLYVLGGCTTILRWNGTSFLEHPIKSRKFAFDD